MYALVVDEQFQAVVTADKIVEVLKTEGLARVQVASFDSRKREWVPVCIDRFLAKAA